jgi:ankyrin repeat protein
VAGNALSSFQNKFVLDRAKEAGIDGVFKDALPYVQLDWILHGDRKISDAMNQLVIATLANYSTLEMTNPVAIPQHPRFSSCNSGNPLGTTLPGILCQQFSRYNGRIINTSSTQEFQIGKEALSSIDFLKTALYFVSNGLLDLDEETALMEDLENQANQQATIDVLFSIDTPTVRASWEKLIRLAIERQSSLYRPLLIVGCRKRTWISGLAPTLASAAIFFFDSTEAIEHIRKLRGAQVSLVEEGSVSIELGDQVWLRYPLQQAFDKADANIVKELMSSSHARQLDQNEGKKRPIYIPVYLHHGFHENPEEQRMACLQAMVDCGLQLNEPGDHGDDTYHRLGCALPLDCYNTLDLLFEMEFMREYEMLLPYSRKFSTSVMVCGILNAAMSGDEALSEYLEARTSTIDWDQDKMQDDDEDEDEYTLILKEIALCKSVFLPREYRYTVLQCLLRNGVDPNLPYLDDYFNKHDDNNFDTAVRHNDFEYLAILLDSGLVIDSAKVLYVLFNKRWCDECVDPLSTRLRMLGFLRDNGLDVISHGMVALAAFLEGGYWSRSDSEVSPRLDEVLTLLRILLDAAANINITIDEQGNSILHAIAAARFGSGDIIAALIQSGANIHALNSEGQTALHSALVFYKPSRLAIVESLLKHGAVTTYPGQGLTLLEELVRYSGDSYQYEPINIGPPFAMLLSRGACINNPNIEAGSSALARLIENRMPTEVINMALEAGADVNAPAVLTSGLRPVEAATKTKNYSVLRDLVSRGANIDTPPGADRDLTMLQSACFGHNIQIVQDLITQGADVNAAAHRERGVTALQAAAMTGNINIAKILIENGALLDLPAAAKNGNLPLDGAARTGRLDMVQYLLNLGAVSQRPGATRYDGAIQLAEKEGHYAIADLMRTRAARLDEEQSWWVDCQDDAALGGFFAGSSQTAGF